MGAEESAFKMTHMAGKSPGRSARSVSQGVSLSVGCLGFLIIQWLDSQSECTQRTR